MNNFVSGNVNNEEDMVKALEMMVDQYAGNSWFKRLQLEHTLLDKQLEKLDSFLEAQKLDSFLEAQGKSTISNKMLGLMQHQFDAMQMYHTFILERLDLAHEEADSKVEEDIQDDESNSEIEEVDFDDLADTLTKTFFRMLNRLDK